MRLEMDRETLPGGQGALLATLLQRYSHPSGKLLGVPAAAAKAAKSFADLGLGDRCEAIVGDMFESVPPGGDVYVLKRILRDWDDEQAVTILRKCRKAMTEDWRLLIIEPIVSRAPGFDYAKLELFFPPQHYAPATTFATASRSSLGSMGLLSATAAPSILA